MQKPNYILNLADVGFFVNTDDVFAETNLLCNILTIRQKPEIYSLFVIATVILVHFENQSRCVSEQERIID